MRFTVRIGLVVALVLCLATFPARCPAGADYLDISGKVNLIPNPGFEKADLARRGTRPKSWNLAMPRAARGWRFRYPIDPGAARSGRRCLVFANVFSRGYDRLDAYTDNLPIAASSNHLLRIWYRTEGVADGEALAKLKYFNDAGAMITSVSLRLTSSEGEWTAADLYLHPPYRSSVEKAKEVSVSLRLDHSPGTIWFDDVGLYALGPTEAAVVYPYGRFRPPPIQTTGNAPVFSPTNRVMPRQDAQGAWWFVRPDGTPFYRTAADFYVGEENRPLIDYLVMERFMTVDNYIREAQVRSRKDLHFNSAGRAGPRARVDFPIKWLNFSTEAGLPGTTWVLRNAADRLLGDDYHYFPDPFSPLWQANAQSTPENIEPIVSRRDAIGYWTDNEWEFGPLSEYIWSPYCGEAFVSWLQGELEVPAGFALDRPYTNIAQVNESWSSSYHTYDYSSFNAIRGIDKPRARAFDDPVKDDLYAFERVVYKKYVDTIIAAVRRREDLLIARLATEGKQGFRHSIISCRIGWSGPGFRDSALRRNMDIFSAFDIIALNAYPGWQNAADHHPREFLEAMRATFHETTGKPVIVAEFGVGARDSGIAQRDGWTDITVNTQAERGRAYHNISAVWANLPWMIGHTWYKWPNGYGLPHGSRPRNCGIVDDKDRYYAGLTNGIAQTNLRINRIRRSTGFSLDDIDWRNLELPVFDGTAPTMTIVQPDGTNDVATDSFVVTWRATDPDSEARITLYASTDPRTAANGRPIASGLREGVDSSFAWTVRGVTDGEYYIVGEINDGTGPSRWCESSGPVTVRGVAPSQAVGDVRSEPAE